MQIKTNSFLALIVFLCASTSLFAQHRNISRLIEERLRIRDGQRSFNTHGVTYNHGKAPQVNNRNFLSTLIDSSKNGYGPYYKHTNPLAYGADEGYIAVYRQWIDGMATHGMIGAATSGETVPEGWDDWYFSQSLNLVYPNGVESPDLPTAIDGGEPQGRYPNAAFVEGGTPTAIWTENTLEDYGGGQYGGYPLYSYTTEALDEEAYWSPTYPVNTSCPPYPCSPGDFWNGDVMIIPNDNPIQGDYKFLGSYTTWEVGSYKTYMITSEYHDAGYNMLYQPYVWTDDLEVTAEGDSLWYGGNYVSTPDYHVNADGVGYMVQVGWSNLTDIDGNDNDVDLHVGQNQGIFYKMTDDYGDSWSDEGGFKNSGYQVFPDAVALRLTDSLYTVWTEEENEYYHHYGDSLWFEGDTLEDGTYIPYLMTPGWMPMYTIETRTDSEGGLHLVFPMLRNICKDYSGGCDDEDGDRYADSLYYTWTLGGSGIWHIYSPDPMAGVDNWTASLVHDMAADYEANWSASDIKSLFHDGENDFTSTMQYFYPNITMSAESENVMWFAVSGMSDYEYNADTTSIIPLDIDLWMAKSTDNGLHWSEAENVTNTETAGALVNGFPSEAALETGVHLASQGMDETVGVFYQIADFNVLLLDPPITGYEDFKNWVYVGVYENVWEYVAIGEENIPSAFTLKQNYPNPFNPITQIQYEMKSPSQVNMELFDIRGAKVRTLINEQKPAGSYEFTFDGSQLSSGVYFYSMTANEITKTRKLVLMK